MYKISSISYPGGGCGDFLVLLILATSSSVKDVIIDDRYLSFIFHIGGTSSNHVELLSTGRVEWRRPQNHYGNKNKILWKTFLDTKKISSVDKYIHDTLGAINSDSFIRDVLTTKWPFEQSIIACHEHISFIDIFNGLDEYFKWTDALKSERTVFVTVTTENSLEKLKKNDRNKNFNRAAKYWVLSDFYKYDQVIRDNKRDQDIVLELEDIYDKEKLKNFISDTYGNKNDLIYDKVYDFYMKNQK